MEEGLQAVATGKRRRSKKLVWAFVGVAVIVVVAVAALVTFKLLQPKDPFTAQVKSYAGFPLYYPAKLPPGYKLDKSSISENPNVIAFVAKNLAGEQIYFSIQPKPADISALQQILKNSTQVLDNKANVIIGQTTTGIGGSFISGKTMVLVNGPSDISKENLAITLTSLKPAN